MPNFDRIMSKAYDLTLKHLGGKIMTWGLRDGGVHFKDPTYKERLELEQNEISFDLNQTMVEWYEPNFPGLRESVRLGGSESVTIHDEKFNTTTRYVVQDVYKKADGKTFWAILTQK